MTIRNLFHPFDGLSEPARRTLRLITALVMAFFTIFTLVALVSYLFTWQADASLVSAPAGDAMDAASNGAGYMGSSWARFLVRDLLGLPAIALVFLMACYTRELFRKQRRQPLLRLTLLTLIGAILFSVVLAYAELVVTGKGSLLGGSLGGWSGAAVASWLIGLFRPLIAGLLLLLLAVIWLVFCSRRFTDWLLSLGEKKEKPANVDADTDEAPGDIEADLSSASVSCVPGSWNGSEDREKSPESETEDESPVGEEMEDDEYEDDDLEGENPADDDIEVVDEGITVTDEGPDLTAPVEEMLQDIDYKADMSKYEFPSIDLLKDYQDKIHSVMKSELEQNNRLIRTTLENYRIKVDSVTAAIGPTITLYKVKLAPGMKIAAVKNVEEDLGIALGAKGVRVIKLVDAVGIEVANESPSIVPLRNMLNDDSYRNSKAELPVAIGYDVQSQQTMTFDLAVAPHLLVAGATRQGKSVGLNVIITSLLYKKHPSELKFVFIDPKTVEFSSYKKLIRHYLAVAPDAATEEEQLSGAIIKDQKHAASILKSLAQEMDNRYALMEKAGVNQVKDYNDRYIHRHLNPAEGHKYMPYLVIVVDEYSDLIMSGVGADGKVLARSITDALIRIAQKGRAAGLHAILATQRPSADVVTPLIKTNFPTKIAFKTSTRFDSSTILASPGAEKLIGNGDMLYDGGADTLRRVQCAYISMDEIHAITGFIGAQTGYKECTLPYELPYPPSESSEEGEGGKGSLVDMRHLDDKFEAAAELVVLSGRGSTSDLQRKLGVGYAKAGRIMDQLEAAGIVGPQDGSRPRQVLVGSLDEMQALISAFTSNE